MKRVNSFTKEYQIKESNLQRLELYKKRRVIDPIVIRKKLPIFETLATILALDYWNAPIWL